MEGPKTGFKFSLPGVQFSLPGVQKKGVHKFRGVSNLLGAPRGPGSNKIAPDAGIANPGIQKL